MVWDARDSRDLYDWLLHGYTAMLGEEGKKLVEEKQVYSILDLIILLNCVICFGLFSEQLPYLSPAEAPATNK